MKPVWWMVGASAASWIVVAAVPGITGRIEAAVVSNTASAGALYLESFVSPLSQELAANDRLSEPAVRALDEVLASTSLGQRVVSFKIWKPGGLVAHASDPALIGRRFEPKPELEAAWGGKVTGSLSGLDDPENAAEAAMGVPLLEVYSPLHEVWSGRVIAVAEFYEVATELDLEARAARQHLGHQRGLESGERRHGENQRADAERDPPRGHRRQEAHTRFTPRRPRVAQREHQRHGQIPGPQSQVGRAPA